MLRTAESEYNVVPGMTAAESTVRLFWLRRDVPRFAPGPVYVAPVKQDEQAVKLEKGDDLGDHVGAVVDVKAEPEHLAYAEVNHGRWIVKCPFCTSAQFASKDDRRFFCVECLNETAKRRWVRVAWPEAAAEIEAALEARPEPAFMSWKPGIEVASLLTANAKGFHHSWSANRTWVVSEVVTAAIMNTYVRDQLDETSPALAMQAILANRIFG